MFTTGTKFLLGATLLAIVAAVVYGISQDNLLGTIGLVSVVLALAVLAGAVIFTRDANAIVDEAVTVDTCSAAQRAVRPAAWPLVFAFGAVVVAVGLVSYQPITVIGLIVILAAGAEWTTLAWSERASKDADANSGVRSRIANPLEFPLAGAIAIGIIVFSFSRIMLWLSKVNTVWAFGVLGAVVMAFAFLFAYRPTIKSRVAVSVIAIFAVGIIAGGAAAGIDGQRDIEEHETTEHHGVCEDPDPTHADKKASQNVSATASVAAIVTLNEAGALTFELSGGPTPAGSDAISMPRSNPTNIVFHNASSEDRRLSVSLGTELVEGEDGEEEEVPVHLCTALVEDGGRQNITIIAGLPSAAFEDGYHFFVPGVDSARLDLVVT